AGGCCDSCTGRTLRPTRTSSRAPSLTGAPAWAAGRWPRTPSSGTWASGPQARGPASSPGCTSGGAFAPRQGRPRRRTSPCSGTGASWTPRPRTRPAASRRPCRGRAGRRAGPGGRGASGSAAAWPSTSRSRTS
ncbi:unnamed protein product, partial [Prorocentrum cordatum]